MHRQAKRCAACNACSPKPNSNRSKRKGNGMTRLILQDANILDGENAPRRGTVVVSGDRIESVGEARVEARPGDRMIALDGRTVMPGMVLGHYHAGYWKMKGGTPLGLD